MKNNLYEYENKYYEKGYKLIAGVDEVGRGCIAGPLVVASCILPKGYKNNQINDSKKLTSKKREELYDEIIENAIDYAIYVVNSSTVDKMNPKKASIFAMEQAIKNMKIKPEVVLIDYEKVKTDYLSESIIKGDEKSISIAASSILAKVYRDNLMKKLSNQYPLYLFDKHKGYGTKAHLDALKKYGPIKNIHRFSYKPIKEVVNNGR